MGTSTPVGLGYPWAEDLAGVAAFKALVDGIDAKVKQWTQDLDAGRMMPSFSVSSYSSSYAAAGLMLPEFDVIDWDTTGGWNLVTAPATWTCPAGMGGKWWFAGVARTDQPAVPACDIVLYKNGAITSPARRRRYWGGPGGLHVSGSIVLVPGDTIQMWTGATGTGWSNISDYSLYGCLESI